MKWKWKLHELEANVCKTCGKFFPHATGLTIYDNPMGWTYTTMDLKDTLDCRAYANHS